MVKYASAMQHGTADPEAILRRFARTDVMHPTYKALAELGRAICASQRGTLTGDMYL